MPQSKEIVKYTQKLSILFVEDDEVLRETTTEILKNFFASVVSAENGIEGLEYFRKAHENGEALDLVLTDIRMPKMDGIELIESIYNIIPKQPVVVLSAHDESNYLLPLINLGIEQFIKKPINFQELLNTFYKISKRIVEAEDHERTLTAEKVVLGDTCSFDKETNILHKDGEEIYLTKHELLFLQLMTQRVGKIYKNEEIADFYKQNDTHIDMHNIRKLVSKMRKKLPEGVLESVYGVGYRLSV